ncbi:unnamed protein product [Linum trigynum]|uniref:Integrase catalytic domain-containing protein n=1 Tax=Linum trigynum TaxID=586398 RepID=A0AAV2DL50_9ROSI
MGKPEEESSGGTPMVDSEPCVIPISSPLYLHPSENPAQLFGSDLLNDSNYGEWVNDITETLIAKNKLVFVDGSFPRDKAGSFTHRDAWDRCDATVKGWLKTAMTREVRNSVRTASTARDIWVDLQCRFSKGTAQRAYELRRKLSTLRQDKLSVSAFYTQLRAVWDEKLSIGGVARCTCAGCSCGWARQFHEQQETEQLFEFLLGLDDAYSVVRSQILSTRPTPTLADAYRMVTAEEQHRLLTTARRPVVDTAVFQVQAAAEFREGRSPDEQERSRDDKDRPRCSNCRRLGHTRDSCYKLVGYPAGHPRAKSADTQAPRRSKAAHVEPDPTSPIPGLTAAQFGALKDFLSSTDNDNHSAPTTHMAGNTPELDMWLIDSGCNEHIVRDISWMDSMVQAGGHSQVRIPDGTGVPVVGIGNVRLSSHVQLHNVLHVPAFKCNLLSVSRLARDHNVAVTFLRDFCVLQVLPSKTLIGVGKLKDGLYYLPRCDGMRLGQAYKVTTQLDSSTLWHTRLGHPGLDKQSRLRAVVDCNFSPSNSVHCDSCLRAKQSRTPFLNSMIKTTGCFDLIHVDIWGPYRTSSLDGSRFFLTIVDDFSRSTWVYLMKHKSDVERYLMMYFHLVHTQYGKLVRRIQADNGLEFQTNSLRDYYEENGIVLQTSCTDTPQQNGVVERKHRHLLETARALMFHAGLPVRFWGDCVLTAAYLVNRLPSSIIGWKTPFEILLGRPASYSHLRSFGCLAYAKDNHHGLDKFAERGRAGVFLGYPGTQKGYRIYDLRTRKVLVSRDVQFIENVFPFHLRATGAPNTLVHQPLVADSPFIDGDMEPADQVGQRVEEEPTAESITSPLEVPSPLHFSSPPDLPASPAPGESPCTATSPAPRASPCMEHAEEHAEATSPAPELAAPTLPRRNPPRDRRPPAHLDAYEVNLPYASPVQFPISNHVTYHRFSDRHCAFLASVSDHFEPRTYAQAVKYAHWRAAMQREIDALVAQGTWTLEFLPPGKRAIDCKWVYKIKFLPDGTIERYKARLVAKGFTQLEGIDFHDTFAPVAKLVTVRVLLAVAAKQGWPLHQLDVNNAFLHGDLDEEVYMKIPQGFSRNGDHRVCRLRKSLYGLRQASRNWYTKFTEALLEFGFRVSKADPSLFLYSRHGTFVAILIYVDDVVITGSAIDVISQVKAFLHHRFSIKDLGTLKYFLGIEVARSPDGIVLSQRKYALDILADSGMMAARPSGFPMEQNHNLTRPTEERLADAHAYRRLIGRLLYLTITRPDIAYSVNLLSQFVQSPSPDHMAAAHRVLRYLKAAPGQGLFLPSAGSLELTAFSDADWAGCQFSRRSTTGYYIHLGGAPVSWRAKKQRVVARSSAEAEYRALASTTSEVLWLRFLLGELQVPQRVPTPLYCDNQAALHIAANPVFHERTKHVEMDCYFVRERVSSGEISPCKVGTRSQLADIFTKALGTDQFHSLLSKLGIRDLHASA